VGARPPSRFPAFEVLRKWATLISLHKPALAVRMPGQQPARYNASDSNEAVVHDLPPIRFDGQLIAIRLQVRRSEDGIFRGRVLFGAPDTEAERSTAEIFCATSEPDLWQAVRDLRDHHLRDLYRSLL